MNPMSEYRDIDGSDSQGNIPETIVSECQNAIARLGALIDANGFTLDQIKRVVYAVHDGECVKACQPVLTGWLGGHNPVMTMRIQPGFQKAGQRLSLSVTLGESLDLDALVV